jgi:hypothetical protein
MADSQPKPQPLPLPAVVLKQQILKHLAALDRIERFYDDFVARGDMTGRTTIGAIVIAEILTNYYTCIETIFLRTSEYFENNLNSTRWHQDLLEKMTLRIEGIRPQLISDEAAPNLEELLRFRHFCRYYLEFDYDWDRLDFVLKKFALVRPLLRRDLAAFLAFLDQLAEVNLAEDK